MAYPRYRDSDAAFSPRKRNINIPILEYLRQRYYLRRHGCPGNAHRAHEHLTEVLKCVTLLAPPVAATARPRTFELWNCRRRSSSWNRWLARRASIFLFGETPGPSFGRMGWKKLSLKISIVRSHDADLMDETCFEYYFVILEERNTFVNVNDLSFFFIEWLYIKQMKN